MEGDDFAARLRQLRARAQLTQKQVAEKMGSSQSFVGFCENGTAFADTKQVLALCELFAVTADYLLGRTDSPTGLAADSWIVDLDALAARRSVWAAKVPRRHKIVDYAELLRLERGPQPEKPPRGRKPHGDS